VSVVSNRRHIAFALVLGALFATSAVATAGTSTTREPNSQDQALAQKGVLHLSDFKSTSGVTKAPKSASGSADEATCDWAQFGDEGRVVTGSANTSLFASAAYVQLWTTADVTKTLKMAQRDAVRLTGASVTSCLKADIVKKLSSDGRVVSVKNQPFPRVGDWSRAYRLLFDATGGGTKTRWQLDMVLVQVGRVEMTIVELAPPLTANPVTMAVAKKLSCRCRTSGSAA
jgi:hypothetical protein